MANGKEKKRGPGHDVEATEEQQESGAQKITMPKGMTGQLATIFKDWVRDLMATGFSEEEAQKEALSRMATTPTPTEQPALVTDMSDSARCKVEIREQEKALRQEAQKRDIIESLETGKVPTYAHYRDSDPWEKVDKDLAYASLQQDLDILKDAKNLKRLLELIMHPGSDYLKVVDLGPGTGRKIAEVIFKMIRSCFVDLVLVDVSPEMLFKTVAGIYDAIAEYIRGRQIRQEITKQSPWIDLVKFLTENGLRNTKHPTEAASKIEKLFYEYLSGELERHDADLEDALDVIVSLGRFILARKFSMHKKEHAQLLNELDQTVPLPLEVEPRAGIFQQTDGSEFHTQDDFTTLVTQIGNVVCNQHPEITLRDLFAKNFLDEPEVVGDGDEENEKNIKATYALLSFHVGKLDKPEERSAARRAETKRILPGYNSEASQHFVSHLFTDPELTTFLDPDSDEELDRNDCFNIMTTFEEDPDNPGYYGVVHRLVFKRKVKIRVDLKDTSLSVTSPHYYEKGPGDEILLLPSYFPTIKQMKELCEKHGLKIVETFVNDKKDPTTAVLLIRKMTEKELAVVKEKLERLGQEEEQEQEQEQEQEPDPEKILGTIRRRASASVVPKTFSRKKEPVQKNKCRRRIKKAASPTKRRKIKRSKNRHGKK
ncbi:hypothetical protein ACFL10_00185 [Patescibacteria group bacterium]